MLIEKTVIGIRALLVGYDSFEEYINVVLFGNLVIATRSTTARKIDSRGHSEGVN